MSGDPHLASTSASAALPQSPEAPHRAGVALELKALVARVTDVPHQQGNVIFGLEMCGLLSAKTIAVFVKHRGLDAAAQHAVSGLIGKNKIEAEEVAIHTVLFLELFGSLVASASPAPAPTQPTSSSPSLSPAGSQNKKRPYTDEVTSPSGGGRFPPASLAEFDAQHADFWPYLAIAASLSVAKRAKDFRCVCGQSLSGAQAYNFKRHLKACAPPLFVAAGAPPLVERPLPRQPTAADVARLHALPQEALQMIPKPWRELIPSSASSPAVLPPVLESQVPPAAAVAGAGAPAASFAEASYFLADEPAAAPPASATNFCVDPTLLHNG
jgi:hypothetical protein